MPPLRHRQVSMSCPGRKAMPPCVIKVVANSDKNLQLRFISQVVYFSPSAIFNLEVSMRSCYSFFSFEIRDRFRLVPWHRYFFREFRSKSPAIYRPRGPTLSDFPSAVFYFPVFCSCKAVSESATTPIECSFGKVRQRKSPRSKGCRTLDRKSRT